jgi:hypothetical protein
MRVDLPDGTYTLTQEGEGTVDGEVNHLSVEQDLDQSPKEPKASAELEEGKHRSAYNLFGQTHLLYFSVFMLCFVHLSFRSCFQT